MQKNDNFFPPSFSDEDEEEDESEVSEMCNSMKPNSLDMTEAVSCAQGLSNQMSNSNISAFLQFFLRFVTLFHKVDYYKIFQFKKRKEL